MKKFLSVFCTTLLISTNSHAMGLFFGADALFANSQHSAKNISTISGPKNGDSQAANKFNYGVNAGFRLDVLNLLASAELFYDNLQTSSQNFTSINNQTNNGDSININNRYGTKANVGFAILPRVTPFLTYGLANVNYSSNVLSANSSLTKSELTPLYGVGLLIDLPLGFSAKASYDYQQFNMSSATSNSKIQTHLGVARLGVIYNF